jgi:hypothetical protein
LRQETVIQDFGRSFGVLDHYKKGKLQDLNGREQRYFNDEDYGLLAAAKISRSVTRDPQWRGARNLANYKREWRAKFVS